MVTGFILAGGKSSRMGRDKALLPVGAHTLIEHVCQRLRLFVVRVIVIGNAHNLLRLRDTRSADAVLTDAQPGYGPLMGIYTGLMHTETLFNVFIPCDMPWVERRLIDRLLRACDQGRVPTPWAADGSAEDRRSSARHGVEMTASLHPVEGVQPFPLICRTTASRRIGALLNRGERSLQALFHQPGTQLVRIEEPDLWRSFTNVNTVEDYAKLTETPVAS